MNGFNYYSFVLNGKERIYYTYVTINTEKEILEWAERYGFINCEDFSKCTNIKQLSQNEIEEKNKSLYKKWWNEREQRRKAGEDVSFMLIPPTIGETQLN